MKEALVKSEKALDKVKRQYQINQFKLQWVDNGKAGAILDKCRTSIMENKYDNLKRQLRLLMTALDDNISLSVATEKQIEEELYTSLEPVRFSFLREDFWRGSMHVIGAPTGVGKTTTLLNMAVDFLHKKKTVLFWAREATASEIVRKLYVVWMAKVHKFKTSYKETYHERGQVLEWYNNHAKPYLSIVADQPATGAALRGYINQMKAVPELTLIDYIQIVNEEDLKLSIRENTIRNITEVRELANESKSIVVVASQLNAEGSPRESSAIKDNAVLFIRLKRKMEDNEIDRLPFMQVNVDKNRHGPLDQYEVVFEEETGAMD